MEKNIKKNTYTYIKLNHFAVYLKTFNKLYFNKNFKKLGYL